jgi:hypothetical protein
VAYDVGSDHWLYGQRILDNVKRRLEEQRVLWKGKLDREAMEENRKRGIGEARKRDGAGEDDAGDW